MGVLNHLIAPRRSTRAKRVTPLDTLLVAQCEQLGLVPGAVPGDGPTGSAWSRAYILGAACASLQQQAAVPVDDQACFATALAAFATTYGKAEARGILAATIAAAEAHEPDVEDGLLQGASDLALVANGEDAATLHFATRNGAEMTE